MGIAFTYEIVAFLVLLLAFTGPVHAGEVGGKVIYRSDENRVGRVK